MISTCPFIVSSFSLFYCLRLKFFYLALVALLKHFNMYAFDTEKILNIFSSKQGKDIVTLHSVLALMTTNVYLCVSDHIEQK